MVTYINYNTNQDGISQNSELKSLSELGITEIRTASIPVISCGDLIILDEALFYIQRQISNQ